MTSIVNNMPGGFDWLACIIRLSLLINSAPCDWGVAREFSFQYFARNTSLNCLNLFFGTPPVQEEMKSNNYEIIMKI